MSGLHALVFGAQLRPPFDPPPIVERPWNSMTLVIGFAGDKLIKVSDIAPVLWSQAGFTGNTPKLEIRVRSVRVWGLSVARPIRLLVYGFSDGAVPARQVLEDWPALNHYPRTGWVWNAALQTGSYSEGSSESLFQVDVGTSGGKGIPWIAYIDILWRGGTDTPISDSVRYHALLAREALTSSASATTLHPVPCHCEAFSSTLSRSFEALSYSGLVAEDPPVSSPLNPEGRAE